MNCGVCRCNVYPPQYTVVWFRVCVKCTPNFKKYFSYLHQKLLEFCIIDCVIMQFADVFWNPTFGDYSGFDAVCEYVRAGRHACSAVADFLKSRAQIEETYAKQLSSLAKSQVGVKFDRSVGRSWEAILANAQRTSAEHQKLADVFSQQSQLTNQLAKTLKQKAKQNEEEIRSCQSECRSLYDKALKNKTEFTKRADQRRSLENERERLKDSIGDGVAQSPQSTSKEIQKVDVSIRKAISSADVSKQQCVNILQQLDVAKKQCEAKTADVLINLNEIERNRIVYLRSLFWVLMNAICKTCVDIDKECDSVRNVILKCDPDSDLEGFISLRKTGEKRPEAITFENIGNATISPIAPSQRSFKMTFGKRLGNPWKSSNGHSAAVVTQALKTPPVQKATSDHRPIEKESPAGFDDMSSSDGCSSPQLSPVSPTSPGKNGSDNGFQSGPPTSSQLKKRALKNHSQQYSYCLVTRTWADNQGIILIHGGARVKLLEKSSDALWFIELEDGQTLYCPVEYLQEIV